MFIVESTSFSLFRYSLHTWPWLCQFLTSIFVYFCRTMSLPKVPFILDLIKIPWCSLSRPAASLWPGHDTGCASAQTALCLLWPLQTHWPASCSLRSPCRRPLRELFTRTGTSERFMKVGRAQGSGWGWGNSVHGSTSWAMGQIQKSQFGAQFFCYLPGWTPVPMLLWISVSPSVKEDTRPVFFWPLFMGCNSSGLRHQGGFSEMIGEMCFEKIKVS